MAYDYDIIIIGGGLGGAALGKTLAEKGVRALVLERETAFRDRLRGEYMHPWGVAEARALGLYELLKQTCGY
jgi:2-polyprenyl-6-methoxyphenol hydroxylase-like FAD-dependent oxidoreductase